MSEAATGDWWSSTLKTAQQTVYTGLEIFTAVDTAKRQREIENTNLDVYKADQLEKQRQQQRALGDVPTDEQVKNGQIVALAIAGAALLGALLLLRK